MGIPESVTLGSGKHLGSHGNTWKSIGILMGIPRIGNFGGGNTARSTGGGEFGHGRRSGATGGEAGQREAKRGNLFKLQVTWGGVNHYVIL